MVVMIGPFDFLTTSRSGERLLAAGVGGGSVPPTCLAFSSAVQPVRTAAAPMVALRIRNLRRSAPAGAFVRSSSKNVLSFLISVPIFLVFIALKLRQSDATELGRGSRSFPLGCHWRRSPDPR